MFLLLSLAVMAGCASNRAVGANESQLATGFPILPHDAGQVAERLAGCNHWAGEAGGNPDQREQEIRQAIAKLRCDRIQQDVVAIRAKYAGNRLVEQALADADGL